MDTEHKQNGEDVALNKLDDIEAPTAPSEKVYRPININHYATKKTVAQSMLDISLLMANSSQLKTVLCVGPHYRYYIPLIVLLSLSITFQVMVGLLLIFIGKPWSAHQEQLGFSVLPKDPSTGARDRTASPGYGKQLAWLSKVKYDLNNVRKHSKLNTMNNIATVFVFVTVLINVFITALGFEGNNDRSFVSPVISAPQLSPVPTDFNVTGSI